MIKVFDFDFVGEDDFLGMISYNYVGSGFIVWNVIIMFVDMNLR